MNYVEFGHHGLLLLEMHHVTVKAQRMNPCLGKEKEKMERDVWLPSMTWASTVLALQCGEDRPRGPLRLMLANKRQMVNQRSFKEKLNLVALNRALDQLHLPRQGRMPLRCLEV